MSKNIIILLLILTAFQSGAQEIWLDKEGRARELSIGETIKTIQLYREGWPMSYPLYRLDENIPLVLGFDELSDDIHSYYYTFKHCDADWKVSDLSTLDYLEGYEVNPINDYQFSFSTYYNYVHYSLKIPNDDVKPVLSGNYILIVFRDNDEDKVVFTKRFMITSGEVDIEADAHRPVYSMYRDCCQEVDVKVHTGGYEIQDPFTDSRLIILQNGLWDYSVTNLKPLIVNPGLLDYDYQEGNIFSGGNEFRFFDTKNLRVPSYYVQKILYIDPYYHFELKTDEAKPLNNYFFREDINGRYYIESEDSRYPDVDADYVFVHFSLDLPLRLEGGNVFVTGAFNLWQFGENNRLDYNPETGHYEKMLLLKQGLYNYRYVYLPENVDEFDLSEIEGTHFETENEYLILFYHRGQGDRYDRLIGHQVVHSNQN